MEINIIELEYLPVFVAKNSRAPKCRKHKGFRVFLLYRMLAKLLKYEENKTKRAKNAIFRSLKALQNKGFNEISP